MSVIKHLETRAGTMAERQQFTTRPLSWQTGTEIIGLNLKRSDTIADETIVELWRLLGERGILLFRDQFVDHEQHLQFTRRFGPLAESGFLSRYAPEGYPDLFTVTNIRKNGVKSETEVAAAQWHADQSFLEKPARASILRCVETPDVGGDTMFANMYQAFDSLSDGLKQVLEKQKAFHTLFSTRAKVLQNRRPPTGEELERMGGAMHPVVITHPDTGRKCLFISEQVVDHFDGWTIAESAPLLDYIYMHATQPAFTYRHAWRPGDMIFWDNRCTQHYTPVDYDLGHVDLPENRRLMFRSTLA